MNLTKIPKKLLLLLLFPLGMLLFRVTAATPRFIENFYSKGVNKLFFEILSTITGIFPFSLAELGLLALAILIPVLLILSIIRIIKKPSGKGKAVLNLLANIFICISVVYFALVVLWTLNYNRLSFAEIAGLDTRPATVSELEKVCEGLVEKANTQRLNVNENTKGVMLLQGGTSKVFKHAKDGYKAASALYPELSGSYGRPKPVLLSKAMSYTNIIGIFCPFTGESNIDIDIPNYSIPVTVCHEMAHQHGFAREDEANFIGWLTCEMNPDADFQYSGTMLALINATNALFHHDRAAYNTLYNRLSPGVRRDLANNSAYWKRHEGVAEKVTTSLNNAYLKSNNQKDGVYSYGRMVDLLIAEYRKYQHV